MTTESAPAPRRSPLHEELGFTFWWDVRKLWEAELPVVPLVVSELEWLLDLPFWNDGKRKLAVCGRDVAADPDRYRSEYERTMAADLAYPINVIWLRGRWTIMDGVHRLLKAHLMRHDTILAKLAYADDIPLFNRQWWEPHNHP